MAKIVEGELPETLVENRLKLIFATTISGFSNSWLTPEQVKALIREHNFDFYRKRGLRRRSEFCG